MPAFIPCPQSPLASRTAIGLILLTGACAVTPARAEPIELPPVTISANSTRLDEGIVGASTTIINSEEIEKAPGQTIQDVLATKAGVQTTNLFGGVNGAMSAVDVRGFGAFATANTLILINGRRLNDLDLAGVDLSTLPRNAIERIEITRGNSGAVLYGDNAVGGVINIVTKSGANLPPSLRIEAGAGSYGQREGNISASTSSGPYSAAAFGNAVNSDGYRDNNALRQRNGTGEVRYTTGDFSAFLNLSGDDQHLGLPGGRSTSYYLNGVNQLATDRRGTSSPFDYGDKQGFNITTGITQKLWAGAEFLVDGGVRNKKQQAGYFGDPADPFGGASYVDTTLTTWSITPRLSLKGEMFGMRSNVLTGFDYYDAIYNSDRSQFKGQAPIHAFDLNQQSAAVYWQQTLGVLPSTDVSYGGRLQWIGLSARDRYDATAPAPLFYSSAQATPLNTDEWQHALHVGVEHRLNASVALFGRAARAFRTPNVDERIFTGPAYDPNNFWAPIPQNFALKTQTSHDFEAGIRFSRGPLEIQSSLFDMWLENEIHYNPVDMYNYNLDPTRRYGSETNASYRVSDSVRLRGSFTYMRAFFREGPFAGNDIPLVSRVTANAGVSWDVWQKYFVVDANVRYWGERRLDNDQRNVQPLIPANATLDLKVSGEYDKMFWSFAVNNVFDVLYYDYGIASAFTPGVYNAYPLPGRTFMAKAGVKF
ncbi:MAG: TonB-dependent receptor [Xanthobacteraceae bacterium]|nr:MAG: TonB-dependent receptor [Xanthobacteraceae bacterium]